MVSISLCMIVKNEEETLQTCLDSVKDAADEVIIVDTGSTDHTKEIASLYTSRIYDFPWSDDFAAARNYSFSKATSEYCMWLDADDVLPDADRNLLLTLKETLSPKTDFVMCRYQTPASCYYRERIIRNHPEFSWKGAVHEAVPPSGSILYTDIVIHHWKRSAANAGRNLSIFQKMIDSGTPFEPRERFYYARELLLAGQYEEARDILEDFLNSEDGWIENKIEACRVLSICYGKLGRDGLALQSLFRSFTYDIPRAELCCDIGGRFIDQGDYPQAAFWYRTALNCKRNDLRGGFIEPDCYGYLPLIQLCLCSERMGDRSAACYYNEKAGEWKPNGKEYLHNKEFFHLTV